MLVKENISFQRYKDPKRALGLGKYAMITDWLNELNERFNLKWTQRCIINDDLTIDVYDAPVIFPFSIDPNSRWKGIIKLPEFIQFNIVDSFSCSYNNLTSLRGCPKKVISQGKSHPGGGSFDVYKNKLTSLRGGPIYVENHFTCDGNKLTSLSGSPEYVGGNFSCHGNKTQFTRREVLKNCNVQGKIEVKSRYKD